MNDNTKLKVTYSINIEKYEGWSTKVRGTAEITVNIESLETIRQLDPSALYKAITGAAIDDYVQDAKVNEGE